MAGHAAPALGQRPLTISWDGGGHSVGAAGAMALGGAPTLPGCAALSAISGGPDRDVYELMTEAGPTQSCTRRSNTELVVEMPKTRASLDSDRIMIRPSALQAQYLPDAQWGEPVPAGLQRILVRSFGRYDAYGHVGRTPLGASGDYALISEINDFNAEVVQGGALVRLSVDAQMVREADARVVARGSFAASAPAGSTRTADLIPAFDAAARDLVGQITGWGLGATGAGACR